MFSTPSLAKNISSPWGFCYREYSNTDDYHSICRNLDGNEDADQNIIKTEPTELMQEDFAWDQFIEESAQSSGESTDSCKEITIQAFFQGVAEFASSKGTYNFRTLCDQSNNYHLEITKSNVDTDPENGGPSTDERIVVDNGGLAFFQVNNQDKLRKVSILTEDKEVNIEALSFFLAYLPQIIAPAETTIPAFFQKVAEFVISKGAYNFRTLCDKSDNYHLEITKCQVDIDPENGGPITVARIVIDKDGLAFFQVNNGDKLHEVSILAEDMEVDIEALSSVFAYFSDKWKMCGGIPKSDYDVTAINLTYTPKSYRLTKWPRPTVHTAKCVKWFQTQRSSRNTRNSRNEFVCRQCSKFNAHVAALSKSNSLTEEQRKEREHPTSSYPISLLSPQSQKTRLSKLRQNISSQKRWKLNYYLTREQKRNEKDEERLSHAMH